jgi:hypothetical protein
MYGSEFWPHISRGPFEMQPCLGVKIRRPVSEIIHSEEGRVLFLSSAAVCLLLFTLESNDRVEEESSGLNKNREVLWQQETEECL